MARKPVTYLITAEPERPSSRYWGKDGTKVGKPLAAEFYAYEDAKAFAQTHGIVLDGVFNSVVVK